MLLLRCVKGSQRKRRGISPLAQQEQPSSSKRKKSKRKLAFDKAKDAPAEGNLLIYLTPTQI